MTAPLAYRTYLELDRLLALQHCCGPTATSLISSSCWD
jgi:hypothetical protein